MNRDRIAQALAGSPAAFDSQGLQQPAIDPIMLFSSAAGPALAKALAGMGRMAPGMMASEAGALMPEEAAAAPELLPGIAKGSKVGDPHALYAYSDEFGPDFTKRAIYNLFGDPSHPAIQKLGWGSSLPADVLQKNGIPITGKQL